MARTTPLHELHVRAGAHLAEVDGWIVPARFGDVRAEYEALRHGAALLDLSLRGKLRLTGGDRAAFLHAMLTNDVLALRPGRGCHAAKLDVQGKMVAGVHVLDLEDSLWCDVDPGPAEHVRIDLERHLILEDVKIADETASWALVAVQGPAAEGVLHAAGARVSLHEDLSHAAASIADAEVRVVRRDHAGTGGFDVWIPAARASQVWLELMRSGRGGVPARACGLEALDLRRIEAGVPWAGSEITGEYFPMEAGLDDGWISYTKSCYLGQETISRLHHLGHVNRHLRGLLVQGEAPPAPGIELFAGGRRAGQVTSAALSPALQRPVALAYVHRDFAVPGTILEIGGEGGVRAAVAALPLA